MDILTLSPVLLIIIAIIVFAITKKIFQAIGIALLIFIFFFFVFGIMVYKDYEDVKSRFISEEKLFLLRDDNLYIAGFTSTRINPDEDGFGMVLDDAKIQDYNTKTKKDILGGSYKIIIFEESAFESLDSINLGSRSLSKSEAMQIINSDDSLSEAASILGTDKEYLKDNYNLNDGSQARSIIFSGLVASSVKEDVTSLISGIKSKSIEVYPNTALFMLVKFVPDSVFEKITDGLDIKEKVMN